jgi:hypothetical protein
VQGQRRKKQVVKEVRHLEPNYNLGNSSKSKEGIGTAEYDV